MLEPLHTSAPQQHSGIHKQQLHQGQLASLKNQTRYAQRMVMDDFQPTIAFSQPRWDQQAGSPAGLQCQGSSFPSQYVSTHGGVLHSNQEQSLQSCGPACRKATDQTEDRGGFRSSACMEAIEGALTSPPSCRQSPVIPTPVGNYEIPCYDITIADDHSSCSCDQPIKLFRQHLLSQGEQPATQGDHLPASERYPAYEAPTPLMSDRCPCDRQCFNAHQSECTICSSRNYVNSCNAPGPYLCHELQPGQPSAAAAPTFFNEANLEASDRARPLYDAFAYDTMMHFTNVDTSVGSTFNAQDCNQAPAEHRTQDGDEQYERLQTNQVSRVESWIMTGTFGDAEGYLDFEITGSERGTSTADTSAMQTDLTPLNRPKCKLVLYNPTVLTPHTHCRLLDLVYGSSLPLYCAAFV